MARARVNGNDTVVTQLIVNGSIHETHDPLTPLKLAFALSWRTGPANYTSKSLTASLGRVRYRVSMRNRESSGNCVPAGTTRHWRRWQRRRWRPWRWRWWMESKKPLSNNYTRVLRRVLSRQSFVASTWPLRRTPPVFSLGVYDWLCSQLTQITSYEVIRMYVRTPTRRTRLEGLWNLARNSRRRHTATFVFV